MATILRVNPLGTLVDVGVTFIDNNCAAVTGIEIVFVFPPEEVAVIVAVPIETPVTNPVELTVAMAVSEEE